MRSRKVFGLYTCAENGYLQIEPVVKENNILLLKACFDADIVSECGSRFWLTGTIEPLGILDKLKDKLGIGGTICCEV